MGPTPTTTEFVEFWRGQSERSSNCSSLWLSDRDAVSQSEVDEVMSILPSVGGKDVLELGAGGGRFTGRLAESAKTVTCVDLVAKFLSSNKELNKKHKNITYCESDVRALEKSSERYDLIFSNGLLMYLSDDDIVKLLETSLSLLRPGGRLFFHETCFHKPGSGSEGQGHDLTVYRKPEVYNSLFPSITIPTKDGKGFYAFEIDISKSVQTHVKSSSFSNQICWLLYKSRVEATECHGYKTFQEFLDRKQYSRNGILRYERIFGRDFVSTGGLQTTEEFVKMLNLKPGEHLLDVGCGIGGGGFYMAKTYDVSVTGFDLSANMISIALERAEHHKDPRVQFEICDATKTDYPPNTFDVVYSRDTILHISDKLQLFQQLLKWLKPGGRLLISDYCCREGAWSDDFTAYVKQRGYILLTVSEYGKVLEKAGFVNVRAEDRTDQFVGVLKRELKLMDDIREDFIKEFSEKDLSDLETGWKDKVQRCGKGDQKWGLLYAEKK